jgi:hypothetical protein
MIQRTHRIGYARAPISGFASVSVRLRTLQFSLEGSLL